MEKSTNGFLQILQKIKKNKYEVLNTAVQMSLPWQTQTYLKKKKRSCIVVTSSGLVDYVQQWSFFSTSQYVVFIQKKIAQNLPIYL